MVTDFSLTELFELLWSEDIYNYLLGGNKKYALFKTYPNTTVKEMKWAIENFVLSGNSTKLGRRFYWDSVQNCYMLE